MFAAAAAGSIAASFAVLALVALLVACEQVGDNSSRRTPSQSAPAYAVLRIPSGEAVPTDLLDRLSGWQRIGQVTSSLWLNADAQEQPAFATIVTLEFPSEGIYQQWHGENAATLGSAVEVKRADLLALARTSSRSPNGAVFKANYYRLKVPPEAFREFAKGYIEKFMEVQRQANLLTSYSLFLERGAPQDAQALLILEHLDRQTFEGVSEAKEKLRVALMERDPSYAKYEQTADSYREAVSGTTAARIEVE